jgi:hypothetical protein
MNNIIPDNLKISDDIKIKIVDELIEPYYIEDIDYIIKSKKCWKISGQIFETTSKVLVAIGSILSFSTAYFDEPLLSFFAGSISTLSLAMLQFSSFSYNENKKQGKELNVLLEKLNLDTVPITRAYNIAPRERDQEEREDDAGTLN